MHMVCTQVCIQVCSQVNTQVCTQVSTQVCNHEILQIYDGIPFYSYLLRSSHLLLPSLVQFEYQFLRHLQPLDRVLSSFEWHQTFLVLLVVWTVISCDTNRSVRLKTRYNIFSFFSCMTINYFECQYQGWTLQFQGIAILEQNRKKEMVPVIQTTLWHFGYPVKSIIR